jgi:dihydrofolate reductase
MRKLIVSEFVSLDGVIQAPGGKDEDRDGGFEHGGWTIPYWHDDIGAAFVEIMRDVDAFLLGRRTYETHAAAFEPMPPGDFFGDLMNAPRKYVVSRTLAKPTWRNTEIIRDNVVESVRALKNQPGRINGDSARWMIAAAARSPVTFSTVLKTSGMASTAIRMPIPSAGRPIARKSGASMRNAPRGTPGPMNGRKIAATAIVASSRGPR